MNKRDEALNMHVTPSVKDALKEEAEKRIMSVSALAFIILKKGLDKLGYKTENGEEENAN